MDTDPDLPDLPAHAWVIDPVFGRRVTVPDRLFAKLADSHPDVRGLTRRTVLEAIANADAQRRGRRGRRHVYYREGVGPSRWLSVVVEYHLPGTGEAFTAHGVRRLPRATGR